MMFMCSFLNRYLRYGFFSVMRVVFKPCHSALAYRLRDSLDNERLFNMCSLLKLKQVTGFGYVIPVTSIECCAKGNVICNMIKLINFQESWTLNVIIHPDIYCGSNMKDTYCSGELLKVKFKDLIIPRYKEYHALTGNGFKHYLYYYCSTKMIKIM